MINQIYKLNMIPDKVPVMVRVSQYDQYSRTIIFDLYDGAIEYEIPSGSTITIRGTKPDKTGFEYPCTFAGNRVEFLLEPQVSVISGLVPAELRITSNNEIVGSCNFIFNVEETPLDKDTIISDTELPLIEEASQAAVIAQGAAARAEAEADRAEQVLSTAVKSVNNELPDAQGNVDVVALPDGGTQGQILTKQSSTDGDADWENPLINYEITGQVPSGTPLNADLLQGHPASYFATKNDLLEILNNLIKTVQTSITVDATGRFVLPVSITKLLSVSILNTAYTVVPRYLDNSQTICYVKNISDMSQSTAAGTFDISYTYLTN